MSFLTVNPEINVVLSKASKIILNLHTFYFLIKFKKELIEENQNTCVKINLNKS